MPTIDQLLKNNEPYVEGFNSAGLPMPPGKQVAVVTCMDARIDIYRALGLELGEAHVIRNAGGRVVESLRSLAISQHLLGTEAVMIIHHSDCGMLTFTDNDIRGKLREQGVDADHVAFLPFPELEQSVRDDLKVYEGSPLVRHDIPVRGFVYEVETGRVREVQ